MFLWTLSPLLASVIAIQGAHLHTRGPVRGIAGFHERRFIGSISTSAASRFGRSLVALSAIQRGHQHCPRTHHDYLRPGLGPFVVGSSRNKSHLTVQYSIGCKRCSLLNRLSRIGPPTIADIVSGSVAEVRLCPPRLVCLDLRTFYHTTRWAPGVSTIVKFPKTISIQGPFSQ